MKQLILFLYLIVITNNAISQVPQAFNYQAVARGASGNILANKVLSVKISLTDSIGITTYYSELQQLSTNAFGLFSCLVGKPTAVLSGNLSASFTNGKTWMKVEVDTTGVASNYINMGSQQLTSVPFALYAGSSGSGSPTGNAGGSLSGTYPNPIIANNAIDSNKIKAGSIAASDLAAGVIPTTFPPAGNAGGNLSGSYPNPTVAQLQNIAVSNVAPLNGQILKFNGAAWAATLDSSKLMWGIKGNDVFNVNTGNIGIGTTTPVASAILHINSNNKGLLIPQISLDSIKDVTVIPGPANGLIIYNTTQPGIKNDLTVGYYYYNSIVGSWIRFTDNYYDNSWLNGGLLGIQLRDKTKGVEMLDNYTGSVTNYSPKIKILKMMDSSILNAKRNIPVMVLSGVNKKTNAGWDFRQKASLIFENSYLLPDGTTSGTSSVAISSYTENTSSTATTQTNGLGFYTFAKPHENNTADTPSLSIYRHNIAIGAYATDINHVTEGRLQIIGFSNGDQLELFHPSSINLKWGLYVNSIDSSLNFYSNGSLRSNIDRVTGVYTALSDRNKKKNIQPISPVLESILKLQAYSYHYIDSKDTDRRMIGFMAQDIQPFFPELVYQRYDRDITKPFLTMDYSGLGVIAIKAIQEQQIQIDELKKENEGLKKKLDSILKMLELLQKSTNK